jgi:tetratricopeptide (TPR) repeat protein
VKANQILTAILFGMILPPASLADCNNESLRKGKEALEKNQIKEAIDHLTKAIEKDPKNAEAHCLRGRAYYAESEYEKAIADLSSAINLDSKSAEAFFWRGRVRRILNQQKVGLEDITNSLRLNPKNAQAFCDRAMINYELAEYAKSVEDFKQAIKVEPKWSEPSCWLAYVLAVCPDDKARDGAKAIEYATQSCKLTDWKDYQSLEALAAGSAESGKFEDAIKWQKKALEIMNAKGFEDIGERAAGRLKCYETNKPVRIKSFVREW